MKPSGINIINNKTKHYCAAYHDETISIGYLTLFALIMIG